MKNFDVTAIGNGCVDIILDVPALPAAGAKTVGKQLGQRAGGTISNSACAMARLGLNVASVSCVGTDSYGKTILDDFKKFKVNCDYIRQIDNFTSSIAIIFLNSSGEKSLIYAPGDSDEWDGEYVINAITQSRYLYTMPSDLEKFRALSSLCRNAQTRIAVDIEPHISGTPENLDAIMKLTDVAIFNAEGYTKSYERAPSFKHLSMLREKYQLDALVVTRDAEGVMAVTEDAQASFPCLKVPVVDTTGAGDSFNAAFIFSLIHKKSLQDSLAFSSAVAAMNITHIGARGYLPTEDEVYNFIKRMTVTE